MDAVIEQGAIEALLAALPTAQPATRGTILEMLLRMAPRDDARSRLLGSDAPARAAAGCATLRAGAEAERCQTLASELRQALLAS